jgi:uncharacterized membrane protein YuzA (DUF378 family)
MRLNTIDWIAIILVIIGAINWLLIGLFNFNLVTAIFGGIPALSSIIFVIVGLAGLWLIWMAYRFAQPRRTVV